MGKLVIPLQNPQPDCDRFRQAVLTQYVPPRPALVEYAIAPGMAWRLVTECLGRKWVDPSPKDRASQIAYWDNIGQLWYRLGYDCVRVEIDCRLPYFLGKGQLRPADQVGLDRCTIQGGTGPITNWEEFENYAWPTIDEADLFPFQHLDRVLPEGMGIMGGHEGGIFENLVGLLGYDGLCLRLYDQPGLVAAVAERLGDIMIGYYERLLEIDRVVAIFPGDEMAFRAGTFISPEHMRQYVFPWHARFAALAHEAGRPYFLHAYGQLDPLMPDLLDMVGLDARHGFDSEVCPPGKFKQQWGNRLGVLGGVDTNVLKGGSEAQVRAHVRQVIAECQPGGGFAIGSGSSITDDIPPENYLAMLDEAYQPSGC